MSPPEWAPQAVEPHPGRESWEVGASTIVSRPGRVNQRIQGDKPPEVRRNGAMLMGSCAHKVLLDDAPNRELWLRARVDGTPYYIGGHADTVSPDGVLRDLKTTSLFNVDDDKLAEWVDQVLLYAYMWNHGEVNVGTREEPDWRPAAELFGFEVEKVSICLVSPSTEAEDPEEIPVEWDYETVEDNLPQRSKAVFHHCRSAVRDMVAGAWEPPEETEAEEEMPLRPEDVDENLNTVMMVLADAKDMKDDWTDTYDDYRERMQALTPPGVTLKAHGVTATHVPPSKKRVLDLDAVERVLAETDRTLEDFHETVTTTELNKGALKAFLEDLGVDEEEVTEEKTTRSGYVRVA